MEQVVTGLMWYVVFLFSTTCHEAAHAFTAMKLGDKTAYHGGQVSLDPIPHIKQEPFGMVMIPLISFLFSGWIIGWASTPYDPHWAAQYPKRSALMALAGPLTNLSLVLLMAFAIRLGVAFDIFAAPTSISFDHATEAVTDGVFSGAAVFLSIAFTMNLLLFIFNLIPIPPLDGSGALPLAIGDSAAERYLNFFHSAGLGFLGLFAAWKILDLIFDPIHLFAINLLYPGLGYH